MDSDSPSSKYDTNLRNVGVENKAFSDDIETKYDGQGEKSREKVSII